MQMEKWFLKANNDIYVDPKKLNTSEIILKILSNRKIQIEEDVVKFLDPKLENLHSPLLLPNLIKASNIIINTIKNKKKIRIIGDYDVDGVMSSYILVEGLSELGANVDYDIPSRHKDGYGINKRLIDKASLDEIDLIITCDNGIAAKEQIDYANSKKIGVIVTDHHESPILDGKEILPDALAIINPKIASSKYPFRDICGAFVAFKLIEYLFKISGKDENEFFDKYLQYAAIATICDIMPLIDENRIIVYYGLEKLNQTTNLGLRALIEQSSLKDKKIDVYHIGFIIGPTINSSGRIEDAKIALKLLLEKDYSKALEIASYLRDLNQKRQKYTDDGFKSIDAIIDKYKIDKKFPVIIVRDENLDESVVGIIAGRIKEKYNHPSIVFTKIGDMLKGSGRSIDEYNMFEKISEQKNMLESFGGHAMACGMSMKNDVFEDFVIKVNNNSDLKKSDLVRKVYIDVNTNLGNIDNYLLHDLEKLAPFGKENPRPLFVSKNLKIVDFKVFGKNNNVIKMVLSDGKDQADAILFENIDSFRANISATVGNDRANSLFINNSSNFSLDFVYEPKFNSFNGRTNIQLNITNYRVSGAKND